MCNPISLAAECAGACAGAAVCTCCTKCLASLGTNNKLFSYLPYMIFVVCSGVLALVLRFYGQPLTVHLYIKDYTVCNTPACYGFGAVFRISWALFLFFFTHLLYNAVTMLVGSRNGYKIDTLNWLWKILLWIVFIVISYLIPDVFYDVYEWIARIFGGFFLLLQAILLIDFAYAWNESWTSEDKQYFKSIIAISLSLLGISLAACVLLWIYYAPISNHSCGLENFFVGFTLALTVCITILSISPVLSDETGGGGLLPAAVITLNSWWLCYSALESNPSPCRVVAENSTPIIVISIVLGSISIAYAGWNVATSNSVFGGQDASMADNNMSSVGNTELQKELITGHNSDDSNQSNISNHDNNDINYHTSPIVAPPVYGNNNNADDLESQQQSHVNTSTLSAVLPPNESLSTDDAKKLTLRSTRFHILMCITAMYQAMLFTNWGSRQQTQDNPSQSYDLSLAAMWIKMASQWITLGLYAWSLVAPRIITSRSFNVR